MKPENHEKQEKQKMQGKAIWEKPWFTWGIFIGGLVVVFILGLLASTIMERRNEAAMAFAPKIKLKENESRNSEWGINYPREYNSFLKTEESNFKSKYNGNGMVDLLKEYPNLVVLWAGYGCSKDYNQPRGHFYAIIDSINTLRTGAPKSESDGPQPNTCWTCKSPDVPRLMKEMGIDQFYKGKWASGGHQIRNPIGCGDCHDPKTMNLTITRPALIEAFQRQGIDITKVSHQEKRTLVCAQCHVEYYFKGEDPKKPGHYLTFPWDKGISVEEIEKYYDDKQFADWVHPLSKTPLLKAQHPDYEVWKLGIHARRGLSCADCHMPYVSEGGVKFTSHHIQSPLNHINKACQVCHRQSEEELRKSVYANQDRIVELRTRTEDLLVRAHLEAKKAWEVGATPEEMKDILSFIRKAQWRWDFASAGHGNSAHSPVEVLRILGHSIDYASQARLELARVLSNHHFTTQVEMPDISTKEKAQKFINFDYEKAKKEKDEFLKTVVPVWEQKYEAMTK